MPPSTDNNNTAATPPPSGGVVSPSSSGLDPRAQTLVRAIGMQEGGGTLLPYDVKSGDEPNAPTGTAGGRYQFTSATWKGYAKQILGDENAPMTDVNQNKVAYTKVKHWLDNGFTPAQAASMWNAGEGAPDAWKNTHQAHGNTPQYVKNVQKYAQQIASGQPPEVHQAAQVEDNASTLGKIINWAFPVAGDVYSDIKGTSNKTPLQQLGDLGLSALWFAPGIGEGAEAAIRGTGLLGEAGSKIAGQAIGGGAIGYGSDVASKLSQGQTDAGSVLTPGLGTLTGGVLGGAIGKLSSKYGQAGVLRDTTNANNSVFGQWKKSANKLDESFAKGKDPGELAAKKGLNVSSMYNPDTVAFETKDAGRSILSDAHNLDTTLTEALRRTSGSATATELENALLSKVSEGAPDRITGSERQEIVKSFFQKVRSLYGENIPLGALNEIKGRAWTDSIFDGVKTNTERSTMRIIGNTLKTSIENIAKKNGLEGVDEMNKYIGDHYNLADILHGINGNKAKGGRLGDTLTKHTGGAVGAGIGAVFGGGPIGSILGFLGGEYAGGKAAAAMRRIGASPLRTALLKRITTQDPQIVQKMMAYAKTTPKGLEALKEQLGTKGIPIFKSPNLKSVPLKTPQVLKGTGLMGRLLTTASARGVQTQ